MARSVPRWLVLGALWAAASRLARSVPRWLVLGALWAAASAAGAQDTREPPAPDRVMEPVLDTDDDETLSRFTDARWAQVYPERDFEGGCTVGFLAFEFRGNGFFIFNNRIRGFWRLDENTGNLVLRTKDGVRFLLVVDGNTLRPTGNLPFLRRTNIYRRCNR